MTVKRRRSESKLQFGISLSEAGHLKIVGVHLFAATCLLLFVCGPTHPQTSSVIKGVVVDSLGSAVKNARIECANEIATSGEDGHFTIEIARLPLVITVAAPGFATFTTRIEEASLSHELRIELKPAPVVERIDVNAASDQRVSSEPFSRFNLKREDILSSGALVLDDVLRQLPGFSLFRRAGSLTANPTSQGVSLRGVGANGASRALIMLDGIPLNSPFGGWVYWNRVSRTSIDAVTVVNAAASDVYGSAALGGVVNLKTRDSSPSFAVAEVSYGNLNTPSLSFDAGKRIRSWGIESSIQALRTSGYILVPSDERGVIDRPAGTADLSGSFTLRKELQHAGQIFLRVTSFGESRENGTPLQVNDTRIAALDLGADWPQFLGGDASLRVYGSHEVFNQVFSAVAADRNSEAITNRQRNPSQQIGLALQWNRAWARVFTLQTGFEFRNVRGHSAEVTFASSRPTANIDAGGRQGTVAGFGQLLVRLGSRWFVTVGGRLDQWHDSGGFSNRAPVGAGAQTFNIFPDRSATAMSPRLSVVRSVNDNLSISGSVYRSFRAPTLNELYRSFRVGNVVTNANAGLTAEHLTGGELGMSFRSDSDRFVMRGNAFWNVINDPVANVTLTTTPALITRRRQNLGSIDVRGIELSSEVRLTSRLRLAGEYLLTRSIVKSFPASSGLVGLRVPQIPRHQANVQLNYYDRVWSAGFQGRWTGVQYDDDRNTFPLAGFLTVDAEVSRRLASHLHIFAAAQNLTGTRYEIGRTPVTTVGPPALIRAGLRISFPANR